MDGPISLSKSFQFNIVNLGFTYLSTVFFVSFVFGLSSRRCLTRQWMFQFFKISEQLDGFYQMGI